MSYYQCDPCSKGSPWGGLFDPPRNPRRREPCPDCGTLSSVVHACGAQVYTEHFNESLGCMVGSRDQEQQAIRRIYDESQGSVLLEERGPGERSADPKRQQQRIDKKWKAARESGLREFHQVKNLSPHTQRERVRRYQAEGSTE